MDKEEIRVKIDLNLNKFTKQELKSVLHFVENYIRM